MWDHELIVEWRLLRMKETTGAKWENSRDLSLVGALSFDEDYDDDDDDDDDDEEDDDDDDEVEDKEDDERVEKRGKESEEKRKVIEKKMWGRGKEED